MGGDLQCVAHSMSSPAEAFSAALAESARLLKALSHDSSRSKLAAYAPPINPPVILWDYHAARHAPTVGDHISGLQNSPDRVGARGVEPFTVANRCQPRST